MRCPALAVLLLGCSHKPSYQVAVARDFEAHPAVVTMEAASDVYALSDVHGGYDRMVALLAKAGVIARVPAAPRSVEWSAKGAILVVTGDLIDKGAQSLEVVDSLMALETSAASHGGRVVVALGNHEAEFFVDPRGSKASAFDTELDADGVDPMAIAAATDPRGVWLRDRPFAVRVARLFFAHSGNSQGRSVAEIEQALRAAVRAHDNYDDPELVGSDSILEARDWYGDDDAVPKSYASALGADLIVFGHDPKALGPRGAIARRGSVVRIDCGMSPAVDDSQGALLHARIAVDGTATLESIAADGAKQPL